MPNNLTIPSPEEFIASCPHCGQKTKINPIWFQRLKALLDYVNSL